MEVMQDSAYKAPFVLEVLKPREEGVDDFLQRAYKAGEWLYSL